MREDPSSLTEEFYYDRKDNQFFSVLLVDYFILDEHPDADESSSSSYSIESLKTLQNRTSRIMNNDIDIVTIPSLGKLVSESVVQQFLNEFISANKVNLSTVTIWELQTTR